MDFSFEFCSDFFEMKNNKILIGQTKGQTNYNFSNTVTELKVSRKRINKLTLKKIRQQSKIDRQYHK